MSVSKAELNHEARRYIEKVFEKRLREEGFFCPNDKLLCWYRLHDNRVIHSIIFYVPWGMFPVFLQVAYGIHPLFVKPQYTPNVRFAESTSMERGTFWQESLREDGEISMAPFSSDILVVAPTYGGRGLYTFDSVLLPMMNGAKTIEGTHLLYKEKMESFLPLYEEEDKHDAVFPLLIDTTIYVDDYELYPICKKKVLAGLEWCDIALRENPENKSAIAYSQRLEPLHKALFENGRKEYLELLENRIECNLRYVQRKFRIPIDGNGFQL